VNKFKYNYEELLQLKGNDNMIKVELLIVEDKVEEVKTLLREIGIKKMILSEVKEYDDEHSHTVGYRGAQYLIDVIKKVKMEILLSSDSLLNRTLDMLAVANIDADISVYNIMKSYRVLKHDV